MDTEKNVICSGLQEVQNYYLNTCKVLKLPEDSVILKTDAWNEVGGTTNGFTTVPIAGKIPRVVRTFIVEFRKDRAEEAERIFRQKPVTVMNQDLRQVEFPDRMFDAILDMTTISYMPFLDAQRILVKYQRWLKNDGILLVAPWLTQNKSRMSDATWTPDTMYKHNKDEFLCEATKLFQLMKIENPVYTHGNGSIAMLWMRRYSDN